VVWYYTYVARQNYKNINKNMPQKQTPTPIKKPLFQYPAEVLEPVRRYLSEKLGGLEKRQKEVEEEDPFNDRDRLIDNASIDTDAAERVGHMRVSAVKQSMDRSIVQVRKALTMIKIGHYGTCEKCGKMIDTDRLIVMPETTICLDCEKKKEK
jgi:RNA polymerase-binding transcription factor DksA